MGMPGGPSSVKKALGKAKKAAAEAPPMLEAAKAGDTSACAALIAQGQSADVSDGFGTSALSLACRGGHLSTVEALLAAKACVNPPHKDKDTFPLFAAAGCGHKATCEVLLSAKADILALYGDFGTCILHHAIDKKQDLTILEFLLQKKADPNTPSESGTPLSAAAQKENEGAVSLLLSRKASPLHAGLGTSAISHAAKKANISILKILLEAGGRLDAGAVYHGLMQDVSEFDSLITSQPGWALSMDNEGDTPGYTALHVAAVDGNHATAKMLCEGGADPNAQDKTGTTALMISSQHGHKGCTRCLLQFKADVNARDEKGDTPLHYAGWFEKPKVAKILVEAGGADVHAKNKAGKEPENAESPECCIM